jgi:hypothetical protein
MPPLAVWEGPNVTLYESTQAVVNARNVMATGAGRPAGEVRVIYEVSRLRLRRQTLAVAALRPRCRRRARTQATVKLVVSRE